MFGSPAQSFTPSDSYPTGSGFTNPRCESGAPVYVFASAIIRASRIPISVFPRPLELGGLHLLANVELFSTALLVTSACSVRRTTGPTKSPCEPFCRVGCQSKRSCCGTGGIIVLSQLRLLHVTEYRARPRAVRPLRS